jgi:hypothetical protein
VKQPILPAILAGTALPLGILLASPPSALAGPVLCSTTLEAPAGASTPVEVTRCGRLRTIPELVDRRYYSFRAPFARGVDMTHQITDVLGIAMGGGDGTRVTGLGFPDQAIIWDGSAVENTARVLLEEQGAPILIRTADLPSCYGGSLAGTACAATPATPTAVVEPLEWIEPVRGLW